MYAIGELERRGKTVLAVETDLEWIREPVGFGVDPAPAVPLLLLADHHGLDAIAFGTIAEAAYRTGTKNFIDFAQRSIFLKWQSAFHSVDIDYFDCVAPMSELCTTQITSESPYGELAQSCVRGTPGKPCMNCVKCFRKSLIESSRTNLWPSRDLVSKMVANRAIMAYLSDAPIRLEVVLASALSGYAGNDPLLNAIVRRTGAHDFDYTFTTGWYGPGMDAMVPRKYLEETRRRASAYVPEMTKTQQHSFETFDITPNINVLSSEGRVHEFLGALKLNHAYSTI
ncbi:DUF6395 domain-containing protein [Brachybacterium tyrofermentans]|uniref:DUF6395 domain-containing protein n=1 Tax=Brachybacterium tyrofermentans TaxID=47848 RepID=UPI003FD205F4